MRKTVCGLMAALCLATPLMPRAYAATEHNSMDIAQRTTDAVVLFSPAADGTCGTDVTWQYDGADTLTVTCAVTDGSQTGTVDTSARATWNTFAADVRVLRLTGGIKTIQGNAFADLKALECVIFDTPSLGTINSGAFYSSAPVKKAYFVGAENSAFYNNVFFKSRERIYLDSVDELCRVTITEYDKAEIVTDAAVYEKKGAQVHVAAVPKTGYELSNAAVLVNGGPVLKNTCTIGNVAEILFTLDQSYVATAKAVAENGQGTCGTHAQWFLYEDGKLLITGIGDIQAKSATYYPWYALRESICSVVVDNGITSVPASAFASAGYTALREATIGSGVTTIGNSAFAKLPGLEKAEFLGDKPTLGNDVFKSSGSGLFTAVYHAGNIGWPDSSQDQGWKFEPLEDANGNKYDLKQDGVEYEDGDFKNLEYVDGKYKNFQGVTFDLKQNGGSYEAWVDSGYTGTNGAVRIPDTVSFNGQEYKVLGIYANAFKDNKTIKSIYLGVNVGVIGTDAFYGCANFEKFEVADGNTSFRSVDGVLFSKNMEKLCVFPAGKQAESYTVPSSVTEVLTRAFNGCTEIKKVVFDGNCNNIMTEAFRNATGLETVTVTKASKMSIGEKAFYGCKNLASVSLSNDVEMIGKNVFYGCEALKDLTIPFIGQTPEVGKTLEYLGNEVFQKALQTIRVSGGVLTDDVFSKGVNLESIYIAVSNTAELLPGTVRFGKNAGTVGNRAFKGCDKIACFVVHKDNAYYQADEAKALYTKGLGTLVCFPPASEITEYSVEAAATTAVSEYAFNNCVNLEKLSISDQVTAMGTGVFNGCTGITELSIPFVGTSADKGVTLASMFGNSKNVAVQRLRAAGGVLAADAFATLKTLESIHLGTSSEYVAGTVKIGKGFASIGDGAFRGCIKIAGFVVNEKNSSFDADNKKALYTEGYQALICCPPAANITSYRVKSYATEIKRDAFDCCETLNTLVIDNNVTSMGTPLFRDCSGLENLTIPFIGTTAKKPVTLAKMFGINASEDKTIPVKMVRTFGTVLAESTFEKCPLLHSVNVADVSANEDGKAKIGQDVSKIGDYAFKGALGIERFVVDKHNTSYDSDYLGALYTEGYAAMMCYPPASGISFYRVKDAASKVCDYAFYKCGKLATVYITKNVSDITQKAKEECLAQFWVNKESTAETKLGGKTVVMRIEEKRPNQIELYHLTDVLAYESGTEPENYPELLFTARFESTTLLLSDSDFSYSLSGTKAGVRTVTATYKFSDTVDLGQFQFRFKIAMLDVPADSEIVECSLESSLVSGAKKLSALAAFYQDDGTMLEAVSGYVIDNVNNSDCNVLRCAFSVPSAYLDSSSKTTNKVFILERETMVPVREPLAIELQ
jgi:hypothetical protein